MSKVDTCDWVGTFYKDVSTRVSDIKGGLGVI
jgi:hypothetical protein